MLRIANGREFLLFIFPYYDFLIVIISKYHENLAESNMNSNKSLQSQKQANFFFYILLYFVQLLYFIFFTHRQQRNSKKRVKKKLTLNTKLFENDCEFAEKIDNKVCGGRWRR